MHLDHIYEPVPPLRTVLTEPVVLSIANYIWLAFIDIAFVALEPLFFATPIRIGGLGMSPATIGLCLGLFGLLDGIVQGLLLPKAIRRVGLKRLFLTGLSCFIPLFTMFPVINHFAREWGPSPAIWALVAFQLIINCITDMSFGKCSSLNVSTSFTLSPSWQSRLCVPIHDLLRGESASTRECAWHWTDRCLTRPSVRPSDSNIPLRIHAGE